MYSSMLLLLRRLAVVAIIAFAALSSTPARIHAQVCGGYGVPGNVTNLGTEFLLCFMQNEAQGSDPSTNRYQDIYIASAGEAATVTITCKAFPKLHQTFFLQKNASTVYRISDDPVVLGFGGDATIEAEETVDKTLISVIASSPIACYGMNNKQFTADAFLAIPRSVATMDYRVMAYYNSPLGGLENMPSEFAVGAFEDSTTVYITPSALTRSGNPAFKQLKYVLNAGEGVQVQANPGTPLLDLTGSVVTSNKPIVVFGGSARTEAPVGYTYDDQGNARTSRDHLCEEMPPVTAWGYSYVTKNFGRSFGDVVRVLAQVDSTVVKINGKIWGEPLKANKFRDYTFDLSDTAEGNVISVESDPQHTILVGMIAHSAVDQRGTGDPFLAIVPPVDQSFNDFTYFITQDFTNYDPNEQYLIIATDSTTTGHIYIDDSLVPQIAFTNIPGALNGGKHYAAATINQPVGGTHRITTGDPLGFTILAYGWGNVVSYGYTAGGLYKPKQGIMAMTPNEPGVAPGPGNQNPAPPPPGINVKNLTMEKVYFDSARIRYNQNPHHVNVQLKDDISLVTGTIAVGETKTLELTTSVPVQDVITGKVRIWYHSRMWTDMYPIDFPFVITPKSQAGVSTTSEQTVVFENYPNPVRGMATVHFALPLRTSVNLRMFDALGRVVRTVVQSTVNSGDQTYTLNTKGLVAGEYTLELLAPEIGINEHRKMIVVE